MMVHPRQMLVLGGILYFCLGYVSGSCVRMGVAILAFLLPALFWRQTLWLSRMYGRLGGRVRRLVWGVGLFVWGYLGMQEPAQAMFLGKLCGLMQSIAQVGGNTTNLNTLIVAIVNVIRALFIIYLAVALIGVFNAARNDEDWQTAIRTPIIAVIIVGILEAISNLIISGNVTNC